MSEFPATNIDSIDDIDLGNIWNVVTKRVILIDGITNEAFDEINFVFTNLNNHFKNGTQIICKVLDLQFVVVSQGGGGENSINFAISTDLLERALVNTDNGVADQIKHFNLNSNVKVPVIAGAGGASNRYFSFPLAIPDFKLIFPIPDPTEIILTIDPDMSIFEQSSNLVIEIQVLTPIIL